MPSQRKLQLTRDSNAISTPAPPKTLAGTKRPNPSPISCTITKKITQDSLGGKTNAARGDTAPESTNALVEEDLDVEPQQSTPSMAGRSNRKKVAKAQDDATEQNNPLEDFQAIVVQLLKDLKEEVKDL